MTNVQAGDVYVEVLESGTPKVRAGDVYTEALVSGTPAVRAGDVYVEVLVNSGALTVLTSSLPPGELTLAYSQTLIATGGTNTGYTWALNTGTLPAGLAISSGGVISGTPTTPGTSSFTVKVTDSASNTATASLSITVYAALTITTTTLPGATAAVGYSQALAATGGTGSGQVWSLASGTLPSGITLSSGGVISGTSFIPGTSTFTVQITDSAGFTATQALSLSVSANPPENYCPNPSFETSLAGWSALTGTAITQSRATALKGQQSMMVVTDGSVLGEGVLGPVGPAITAATTGALNLSLYSVNGGGTLNVEAVTSTGTVLASTLVTLVAGWQRVILQNFAVPAGPAFGVMLATTSPEALTFWVDAVMYELGVTVAHPYGDGDTTGWIWVGTPELSYSQQLYANATSATGRMRLEGKASPVAWQKPFYTSASGAMVLAGDLAPTNQLPPGSFADFAIFELTDPDPAMTYVDQNNAGSTMTATGTFIYDFESAGDVSNFSASSGSVAQSTGWARTGTHSMLWTTGNTANEYVSTTINVSPGDYVNVNFWVNCAQVQVGYVQVDWYNGVTYLSTTGWSYSPTLPANTPFNFALSTANAVNGPTTAPATATKANVYLTVAAPATGNLIYFDDWYVSYAHYLQSYGLFYPPLDYPVSNGKYLWRRAAFAGIGFYYTGIPAGSEVIASDYQVALAPLTGSTPVPAAFTPPRQVATIIKPTRLNYCPNPSFQVSTAGWTATGSATLALDTTQVPTPSYNTDLLVGNLGPFFNNVGITNDGSRGVGNFGDSSNSYSQQQLILSNLGPGVVVQSGGIGYVMPDVAANTPDNISALGQTIPIGGPLGAQVMGFLGASVDGGMTGISGTVTINYTDGSTGTATLGLSDWTLDAGAAPISFGNQVAGNIPYRNFGGGHAQVTTYIFSQTIPVNPAKAVASITLPNQPLLHIFAISLAEVSGNSFGSSSCKVTVNASGDGMQISIPDLIVGDQYTVSFYTQAGQGIGAISATAAAGSVLVSNSNILAGEIPYGGTLGVGYGQGPYGGVAAATSDLTTGVWYRPSFTFTATASTQVLAISTLPGSDIAYPTSIWVDAVLIEEGDLVGSYFDGSFGSSGYLDYQWEAGGTAGLTRSYYYEQLAVKKFSIQEILNQHIPVGLTAAAPQYLIPYTQ